MNKETEEKLNKIRNLKWISKKGTIAIKDMEESHIYNCIEFLRKYKENIINEKSIDSYDKWIRIFNIELKFRKHQQLIDDLITEMSYDL